MNFKSVLNGGLVVCAAAAILSGCENKSLTEKTEVVACFGRPPPRPAFHLQERKQQLDALAVTLMAKWRQESAEFGPELAAVNLNSRVGQVYEDLRNERLTAYEQAQCPIVSTKKCKSDVGRSRKCHVSVTAPAGTRFLPPLQLIRKDFPPGYAPRISQDQRKVTYTVKKSGPGSKTGGFRGNVGFLPEVSQAYVAEEVAVVHAYFAPLVRIRGFVPKPGA